MDSYNIASFLRARASEDPDRVAIRFMKPHAGPDRPEGTELTFRELETLSDHYARGFERIGLKKGDRTLVLARPSLDFFAFMFGLFKMGAIPVLMDPGMGMKNLLACITQIRPRAVVALSVIHAFRQFIRKPFAHSDLFVTVGRRWFWGGPTLGQVLAHGAAEAAPYELNPFAGSDEACIIFTSGSTGTPKGVSFPHEAFVTVMHNITEMFGYTTDDVWMEAFSSFVFFDVCAGMTTVVPEGNLTKLATVEPADIVKAIQDNECTGAFASPIVWTNVLRLADKEGTKLPSLKRAVTTGAPIQTLMHRRFRGMVNDGVHMLTPYGATEALTVACISSEEILGETMAETVKGAGTCVGRAVPGTTIRIVRITEEPMPTWSDDLQLPTGDLGEIVADTVVASPEYKDNDKANAESKIERDGRIMHRMGDIGYLDDQARLWFCGRKAHRLETADGIVPAVPVEGIFNEHPAVFRTALVGLGTRGSELPMLIVELVDGQTWSAELEAEVLALAEGTRWEDLVQRVTTHDGFPVDARHNSKIRREDLKAWAEQQSLPAKT